MNHDEFLRTFLDYLAPKMDAYEQIIYLYVYRHTVLESKDSAVSRISFREAKDGNRDWRKWKTYGCQYRTQEDQIFRVERVSKNPWSCERR
jgi:hypothetical protein